MGINVINEDLVRGNESIDINDTYLIKQWAYINRILKSADWVARQDNTIHFMEMTSFGCGPDAFLQDEIRGLLQRHGKALTLLKIDDVSNIGSLNSASGPLWKAFVTMKTANAGPSLLSTRRALKRA